MNDLNTRIRAYRTRKGLTANAFGLIVGRDRLSVYNWEKGASMPNPAALYKLEELGIITAAEREAVLRGKAA